jgi:hypothetical protein
MEKLYEAKDLQGCGFGEDRQFTVEGWREQAKIWCDMDDNDDTYEYLELLKPEKVLDFIADYWDLEFTEVD